jgi:hypothetical protein
MIDGHKGKSPLLLELWWGAVLWGPQQKKLGYHGEV